MKTIRYAIRQKAKYSSKYCYYQEIGRYGIDGWTKNLSQADFYDAGTALKIINCLKYNSPKAVKVIFNGNNKIVKFHAISKPKLTHAHEETSLQGGK